MKKLLITALALTCMSSAASADSIQTFRQLCLSNAGNPAAIINAGKKNGFKMLSLKPDSSMGMRDRTDESLQVNVASSHKFECAVTTSDMPNPQKVSADFFASLGLTPKRGKAVGTVNGNRYTFIHDTKGGEAFVMYAN